jgi:2-octaprenyl-6-methoxyphenol hydroxylase
MTRDSVDVFISGGGIAGLAAAAAFGQAGFSVVLADPAPPVDAAEADGSDLRSTAFLQPARDLFERTGLWEVLAPHAMPLEVLRAVDTVGWPPEIRASRDFRADDISDRPFGWNLLNWRTRHVLTATIAGMPRVDLRMGTGFARCLARDREAIVTLSDGASLSARLVVAADGRDSPVREAAGIGVTTTRYGQKAIAFTVMHPHPHDSVSTELYNDGGAFVLVPLPDVKGGPASAVVWMNDGRRSLDLLAMDEAAFSREATLRSCGVQGELTLASPRRLWPVVTQRAERLTAQRTAIVAEAAHVLPPIGAQGLNTSLHDIVALVELAAADPENLGGPKMLAAYEATRERDIRARAAAIDLFNRVCRSGEVPVQALRLAGLKAVHDIAPLRRAVMRAGLGTAQRT